MAPRSALANISFTVDSASEDEMTHDELNALPTPDSNTENKAPTRKARGTAAQLKKSAPATKVPAKGRPATRRASSSSMLAVKQGATLAKQAPVKSGRKALAERKVANGSDTEEVEEFEEDEAVPQVKPIKRGRPPVKKVQEEEAVAAPARAKKGRKASAKEPAANKEAKTKTAAQLRNSKRALDLNHESGHVAVPESQPGLDADLMDIEESIEMDKIPESMPPPPRPSARRAQAQPSKVRQASNGIRRTGSVSDSERDPVLRRKVGDLTRKLEAMNVKYDALKEAASVGKDSNFEQLKKRTDQTMKGTLAGSR